MTERIDHFSRVRGRVDLELLGRLLVLIVGVGSVGSSIAEQLARGCGVGHVVLVDGDRLERANLARHRLPAHYLGANKAEAMTSHLVLNVPGLDVAGAPLHLDDSFTDMDIDRLIGAADLVVIATDHLPAQRRLARRSLAMDVPAVAPALYAAGGGEVFAQLNAGEACYACWDSFRDAKTLVRGVISIDADALAVIQQAVYLCLAILDPRSLNARDFARSREDPRPRQLFQLQHGVALRRATVERRPHCAGCAVGASTLAGEGFDDGAAAAVGRLVSGRSRARAAGWSFSLSGAEDPPTISLLAVSGRLVVEGDVVTLSWATENATHVEIDGVGLEPPQGRVSVPVLGTTVFRLRAVNPFGATTALSPVVRTMPRFRMSAIAAPVVAVASLPAMASPLGAATAAPSSFHASPQGPSAGASPRGAHARAASAMQLPPLPGFPMPLISAHQSTDNALAPRRRRARKGTDR